MLQKLLTLAKKLRSPGGCPWDRKQTLKKIPHMLIEESQEIALAIKKRDKENLKEEIGDVLFNLCLLITMAEEKGYFTAQEVIDASDKKIRDRHTWVFGKDKATTAEEAVKLWKKNKLRE